MFSHSWQKSSFAFPTPHYFPKEQLKKKKSRVSFWGTRGKKNVYNVEKKHCSSCDNPFHQFRPHPSSNVVQVYVNIPSCLCPLYHTDSHQDPLVCLYTSNRLCSQRRQALRISSGSAFHLTSSRVCWLTAQRWRPHRPCGRHLYSLAGRAVRCKRGGGDTWDTCLSVYCNLGKKQVHRHILVKWKLLHCVCVCVCLFFPKISFVSRISAIPIKVSPPRLSSVSVFRVDEPTAVSRLMEWSVRLLQWERSNFVKWGMWRITRRRVESLMSRPASRKHCMVRNWLRLSQPGTEVLFRKKRRKKLCFCKGVWWG